MILFALKGVTVEDPRAQDAGCLTLFHTVTVLLIWVVLKIRNVEVVTTS